MERLFNYISKRATLSNQLKEYINSIAKVKKLNKAFTLIYQDQTVDKTFFVVDGCLRAYAFAKDGKEHTLQFALKDNWVSDYIAIFNNEKSTQIIESVSESIVIELSINEGIENVFSKFPEIETLHRKYLQRHIVSLQKRVLNQLQLTSFDRYKIFLNQYPEIEKYALNYHIASYLGITPQSLSRLRSKNIN